MGFNIHFEQIKNLIRFGGLLVCMGKRGRSFWDILAILVLIGIAIWILLKMFGVI